MLTFVTIVHVLLCVFMIFVILLQPGKDAGMGGALGGGAATSAFGGRGAVTFLSRVTAISAAVFFITSLGLSMGTLRSSVAERIVPPSAPAGGPTAPADAGTQAVDPSATTPAAPTATPPAAGGTATPGAPPEPVPPPADGTPGAPASDAPKQ